MTNKFPIPNIIIPEGTAIRLTFMNSDGSFEVHFNTKKHPYQIVVKETDGLGGSLKGRANELLYIEDFNNLNSDGTVKMFNEYYTPKELWAAVYRVIPAFAEARDNGVNFNLPHCLRNAAEDLFVNGDAGKEHAAKLIRRALCDLATYGELNYEKT